MSCHRKTLVGVVAALMLLAVSVPLLAAGEAEQAVGQVVGRSVELDGIRVPSGTTVWSRSLVRTGAEPAVVHMGTQVLELSANSSAFVELTEDGGIRVTVRTGSLSYPNQQGEVVSVAADSIVEFNVDGASADESAASGVAVLVERAREGKNGLIVNDVRRINAEDQILVRTLDGRVQQVACVRDIREEDEARTSPAANRRRSNLPEVRIREDLVLDFEIGSLVVQGEFLAGRGQGVVAEVMEAADRGAKIVGIGNPGFIDPLRRVIIRSADLDHREVHCLRALFEADVREEERLDDPSLAHIKIGEDLRLDYGVGAQIVQREEGGPGFGQGLVANLVADEDRGDAELRVDSTDKLSLLDQVLIQSTDGKRREVHCLRAVDRTEGKVTLTDALADRFETGAELHQGPIVRQSLDDETALPYMEQCTCCPAGGFPLAWRPALIAAGAVLVIEIFEDDPEPVSPFSPQRQ